MLTDEDKRALLGLARRTVEAAARGEKAPELTNPSGALRERGAAFVTLRIAGELRGCIGHVQAVAPLWESVHEMAGAAAERDSRFPPLRPEELEGLSIEVSVLSAMAPIRADQIVVGTHGLYVRRDGLAGILLPQVAVEWGWDGAEFLRRTFEKAGLPYPHPEVQIFAFTAERFSG